MREFFFQYGGLSVVAFLIALLPQVVNNIRAGAYQSGPKSTWTISLAIILQSFILTREERVELSTQEKILVALRSAQAVWAPQDDRFPNVTPRSAFSVQYFLLAALHAEDENLEEAEKA